MRKGLESAVRVYWVEVQMLVLSVHGRCCYRACGRATAACTAGAGGSRCGGGGATCTATCRPSSCAWPGTVSKSTFGCSHDLACSVCVVLMSCMSCRETARMHARLKVARCCWLLIHCLSASDDSGSLTPTSTLKRAAWAGSHLASALLHPLHSRVSPSDAAEAARQRWALLRMHFVSFPAASRRATLERWADIVSAALEAARVAQHRRHAAELLLRWDPSSSRMRGGSLGAAEQAARLGSLGSNRAALLAVVAERSSAAAALDCLPSGQPLVMSAPSSVATSRCSSASSSGLCWQQRDLSAIARTVSRRNLLAPPMQQLEGANTSANLPVHQEWQAYEQHVGTGKGLAPVAPELLQQQGPSP